jgi:hypothetical protein
MLRFSFRAHRSFDRFYFRYNSAVSCVWGVCGSFHGASQVFFFFWGGHFGEIGPFYAHFSPKASKRDFLGSEILFFATGAASDRPPTGLGFGLAARG